MTRQTSIEAYNAIRESGALSELRWRVYDYVYNNGPCTAKNVHLNLREEGQNDGCYTTRLSELRESGLLEEVGTKICEFTGRRVTLWDVTGNMPKKITKREKLQKQINETVEKLDKLRQKLAELDE